MHTYITYINTHVYTYQGLALEPFILLAHTILLLLLCAVLCPPDLRFRV
jgi:hypothetical protein